MEEKVIPAIDGPWMVEYGEYSGYDSLYPAYIVGKKTPFGISPVIYLDVPKPELGAKQKALAHAFSAIPEMLDALLEVREYLDGRADADMQGDPAEYVPNAEMRLLGVVDEALGKAGVEV